jgi:hypothetical protein
MNQGGLVRFRQAHQFRLTPDAAAHVTELGYSLDLSR